VDLSAVIFVVLALAWAVYLIPKALKHHDEMASDRLVEGHSDKVRVLSRKSRPGQSELVADVVEVEVEHTETVERTSRKSSPTAPAAPVTRATARKAAQRRRRVLGVLVLALAVVWGLTWFAYLPIWAPAVPGALVLGWLVLARLSVRKQTARRRPLVEQHVTEIEIPIDLTGEAVQPRESQDLVDLLAEDTVGLQRQDIEAALADDGSLWDPLPLTLPTYVNKARARRTVRTIELTGINSSGHDQSDSALAREAEESGDAATDAEPGQRKAAGA
jgi:hypothetical protein